MGGLPVDAQEDIPAIQAGDADLRERFLASGLPFVRRETRRFTRTFFVDGEDEFAIALETFNSAIDSYRADRGVPFEAYARLLIRNRLVDESRRNRRRIPAMSLSEPMSEEGPDLGEMVPDPRSGSVQDDLEYKEAVLQLELDLSRFGLDMARVAGHFPKHLDSRLLCIRIARCVVEDETLRSRMLQEGRLPGAELSRRCGVPRKTVERNRAGIVLLALLMRSELRLVHTYISFFEREGMK